jgi:hypothetical protein
VLTSALKTAIAGLADNRGRMFLSDEVNLRNTFEIEKVAYASKGRNKESSRNSHAALLRMAPARNSTLIHCKSAVNQGSHRA